jgi:hypothetical protein
MTALQTEDNEENRMVQLTKAIELTKREYKNENNSSSSNDDNGGSNKDRNSDVNKIIASSKIDVNKIIASSKSSSNNNKNGKTIVINPSTKNLITSDVNNVNENLKSLVRTNNKYEFVQILKALLLDNVALQEKVINRINKSKVKNISSGSSSVSDDDIDDRNEVDQRLLQYLSININMYNELMQFMISDNIDDNMKVTLNTFLKDKLSSMQQLSSSSSPQSLLLSPSIINQVEVNQSSTTALHDAIQADLDDDSNDVISSYYGEKQQSIDTIEKLGMYFLS